VFCICKQNILTLHTFYGKKSLGRKHFAIELLCRNDDCVELNCWYDFSGVGKMRLIASSAIKVRIRDRVTFKISVRAKVWACEY